VTGSSIKRIEGESALPVTVVTKEEIARTGVTTTSELLDKISATSGGNYNISQGVGDSGQPGFSGVSLRGLGSSNTLILLNGRRLANYAFNGGAVDVNSIPLSAVERVEILKDGASAIYGTDAIGGVINFILRKDFQGIEGSVYGTRQDRDGGGEITKYTISAGFGDLNKQRFNILAVFDYEEQTALLARDRKFASTAIRPDLGFAQTSGNVYPANFVTGGRNINTSAARGCDPANGSYFVNAATGLPAAQTQNTCRYDFTSVLDIFPPSEKTALVVRGAVQPTNDIQIYGEYTKSENEVIFASSETPVNNFTGNGNMIYPAGGRFYPTTVTLPSGEVVRPTGDLILAWRLKDGGRRTNLVETEANRFVIGSQGNLAGFDYDIAYSDSKSKAVDTYIDGWVSERRLRDALRTGNINVFGGAQDATGQQLINSAKILETVRISEGTTKSFDGKISRELMQLPAGPLAGAIGYERRKEELKDNPQPVLFGGDILGGGGALPPVSGDRTVTAVFGELNVPIMKNLEAQLAIRYDKYSDFGNTTNPKIAVRWNPTKNILVRGSYNTGFRAPTLPDLFTSNFRGNTADVHNDPLRCPNSRPIGNFVNEGLECDAQFSNLLGGNRNLTPEESKQWTLGFIFEPTNSVAFGLDFWGIERENTIGGLGDTTLFGNYTKYDALGKFRRYARLANGRCANDDPAFPTPANVPCAIDVVIQTQDNLGIYKTQGVDVTFNTRVNTPMGNVRVGMEGTYFAKYDYQTETGGTVLNNAGEFSSTNGAISRWRHTLSLAWTRGAWGATMYHNFVLGYKDNDVTRRVGNWETIDLQGRWTGIKNLELTVGVRNLFDRDPPASTQGQTFQVGYDPRYASPLGRTFYGRLTYGFK
jgi:iron complex outermembrane recepter protein